MESLDKQFWRSQLSTSVKLKLYNTMCTSDFAVHFRVLGNGSKLWWSNSVNVVPLQLIRNAQKCSFMHVNITVQSALNNSSSWHDVAHAFWIIRAEVRVTALLQVYWCCTANTPGHQSQYSWLSTTMAVCYSSTTVSEIVGRAPSVLLHSSSVWLCDCCKLSPLFRSAPTGLAVRQCRQHSLTICRSVWAAGYIQECDRNPLKRLRPLWQSWRHDMVAALLGLYSATHNNKHDKVSPPVKLRPMAG